MSIWAQPMSWWYRTHRRRGSAAVSALTSSNPVLVSRCHGVSSPGDKASRHPPARKPKHLDSVSQGNSADGRVREGRESCKAQIVGRHGRTAAEPNVPQAVPPLGDAMRGSETRGRMCCAKYMPSTLHRYHQEASLHLQRPFRISHLGRHVSQHLRAAIHLPALHISESDFRWAVVTRPAALPEWTGHFHLGDVSFGMWQSAREKSN